MLVENMNLHIPTFSPAGNGGVSGDRSNTAEQVSFMSSASSSLWLRVPYVVRVTGVSVPMAQQTFALVASGPIVEAQRVAAGTGAGEWTTMVSIV